MRQNGFLKRIIAAACDTQGQLLVEMLVALVIGGILTLTASIALVALVRYNFENQGSQAASALASNLMSSVSSLAQNDWHNIYDLNKTSAAPYYLVLAPTSSVAVAGDESVFFDDVQTNLVGYWKFDESTGTIAYDSSGNGNNGALINAPARATSTCFAANCLVFNGVSSYVVATTTASLDLYGTVSAWVNGTGQAFEYSAGSFTPGSFSLSVGSLTNGSINTRFIYNDSTYVDHNGVVSGAWVSGGWNQVALVRNNGTAQLYINGELADSWSLIAGKDLMGSNLFSVGVSDVAGTPGNYFLGSLDDVRVYNRALSASEISLLYNNKPYTRYFYVDNVSRDGLGNIFSGGGTNDTSTQMVHSAVSWEEGRTVSIGQYLTRSREIGLYQGSWRGGSGQTGPLTGVLSGYDTSSNIVAGGTLALATTTATGTLVSSIFDTQISAGATIDSLAWQGSLNGGSVQFQFAYASSSSGPWNFYGPGGSPSSYYIPTNSGVPLPITDINDYRYFRYEIFLAGSGTTTPVASGVSIGWSP